MIKRSIPWTSQPQDAPDIDKNNSLSGGLVFSWLAASGISPEQVRGVLPTSESGITRAPNRGGIGASVAAPGGINYALVPFIGIDKYTIAAVAAPPAAAARSHLYISGTETDTFPQYVLAVNSSNTGANASGKFALLEYDAGWKVQAESIVGMVDGGLHTFTAVRDGTTVRLYRDGIDVTGTLGTISGTHSTKTGNVSVGGNVGMTTRGGSFPILSVQAWSRALSVQSAVSHGINPWQIFAPQQRSIYVSVAGGGLSASLGQPSETDTVSALTSAKAQSVGLVASTDTAQAITAVKANSIGLITGTESAQSIASAKACATGQVAETDSLFTISSVKSVSAALVTETETAQPLTAIKYATLGQASESDDALALVSSATSNLGLIAETDTAFALTAIKTAALGLPAESDSALSLSASKTALLGLVTEIEYAPALVSSASSTVGQVVETDAAFAINAAKLAGIGYPTETDSIPSISTAKMVTLGLVTETGYVFALTSADEWPGDTIRLYSPITMTARWQSPISKTIRLNSPI